ncbi:MAG: hypothetical protein KAH13_01760, partial [Tenericutes bacterium]|nr:hypothetical protein [Mycoplasmatota bacterium]
MTDNNFFTKLPYLIIVSLISLGFWAFKLDYIGIPIFVGIIFVLAVFIKNTIYIIPFLLNTLFMVSQVDWDTNSIPLTLYIGPVVVLIAFIIHIIRFKVNIFKGKFFIGLAILVVGMIVSQIINSSTYDLNFFLITLVSLLYVLIYGFFANTLRGDNLRYLIRIFVI